MQIRDPKTMEIETVVEAPKSRGWMSMLRNIGMAMVMLTGGGIGSYTATMELQKETALFRYEIKQALMDIGKRLEKLEDRPAPKK